MIIMRVINPDVSLLFLPWFVENDMTRQEIGASLYEKMSETPKDVCCLAMLDEDKTLRGVAVACKAKEDVFIWQGKTDGKVPSSVVNICMRNILDWAKNLGYKRVLAGPNRPLRVFQRRWGFKPCEKEGFVALEV